MTKLRDGQIVLAHCQGALTMCSKSILLGITHDPPFVLVYPRDGFGNENTQGVQHVIIGYLACFLISRVNIIHSRHGFDTPL